jgi:hypothetical protein
MFSNLKDLINKVDDLFSLRCIFFLKKKVSQVDVVYVLIVFFVIIFVFFQFSSNGICDGNVPSVAWGRTKSTYCIHEINIQKRAVIRA